MSLSPNIKAVLEGNAECFLDCFPIQELQHKLRYRGILSDRQVEEIKNEKIISDKRFYLLGILLKERDDKDFYELCQLLQENEVRTIKQFGDKMLNEAKGK